MASRNRSPRPTRDERRQQLLDAAVEAIRDLGPQPSMEQLAARGGVTKPILYRHFGDREGLGRAIGERFATVLMDRLAAPLAGGEPREQLRATVAAYLEFLEDEPHLYSFLTTGPLPRDVDDAGAITQAVARRVAVTIGDQLRALGLDAGGAEPYAYGVVGMVHQAGDWWIRNRTMSREALTTYLTDLLWHGFAGIAARAGASATSGAHVD